MKPSFCLPGALPREQALELVDLSRLRLIRGRATARAWRVAAAVWALTYPFEKGWDGIFVEELGKHANIGDRRDIGRAIKECAGIGALEWEPSTFIPPKGQPGRLSLIGLPGAPKERKAGADCPHLGACKAGALCPHNLVMSVELNTHQVSIDTGTQHSSLIGASDLVEGSRSWEAERRASQGTQPGPEYDTEELARQLEAEIGRDK